VVESWIDGGGKLDWWWQREEKGKRMFNSLRECIHSLGTSLRSDFRRSLVLILTFTLRAWTKPPK
jgi:hypothetical protein